MQLPYIILVIIALMILCKDVSAAACEGFNVDEVQDGMYYNPVIEDGALSSEWPQLDGYNATALVFSYIFEDTNETSQEFSVTAAASPSDILLDGCIVSGNSTLVATGEPQDFTVSYTCIAMGETTITMIFSITGFDDVVATYTKICALPPINVDAKLSDGTVVRMVSNSVVQDYDLSTHVASSTLTLQLVDNAVYQEATVSITDEIWDDSLLDPDITLQNDGLFPDSLYKLDCVWEYHCLAAKESSSTVGMTLVLDSFENDGLVLSWTKLCDADAPEPGDGSDDDWIIWLVVIVLIVSSIGAAFYCWKLRAGGYETIGAKETGLEMLNRIRGVQQAETRSEIMYNHDYE